MNNFEVVNGDVTVGPEQKLSAIYLTSTFYQSMHNECIVMFLTLNVSRPLVEVENVHIL